MIGPVQAITSGIVQDLILNYRQSPLTWILLLLIWVVEIFGRFVADSKMDLNLCVPFSRRPIVYSQLLLE